jgi:hypothetical protein
MSSSPARGAGPWAIALVNELAMLCDRMDLPDQAAVCGRTPRHVIAAPEPEGVAARQPCFDPEDVVHHIPVTDRARAAGVVAGHPADGGLRRSGHIDGKPQAMRLQQRVEPVEDNAGLHDDFACLRVELDDVVEVLRVVDDQCRADGLPALGRPGSARQDGRLLPPRSERHARRILAPWHDHAHRLDLIDRGIGAVAPARESVE